MDAVTSPKVSVIVPSHAGADRLPRLLEALARQVDAPPFEVCVVVDGDVDDSVALLECWRLAQPELALRYRVFPTNQGRVAALNTAAAMARGHILLRTDDDLEPSRDYIRLHSEAHDGPDPVGVVGLCRNRYPDTSYARSYGIAADQRFRDQAYGAEATIRWRYWAANASIPRDLFWQVGGYDPDYRQYGWEDVDLGYRLHMRSVPVVLHPALETTHHVAAVNTRTRTLRALHAGAARHIFITKHGSHVLPPIHLTGLWGLSLRCIAALCGIRAFTVAASVVDRILPVVPSSIGEKAVAILVESAGLAGSLHPERARDTF